jgi:hypothetical protein
MFEVHAEFLLTRKIAEKKVNADRNYALAA